MDVFEDDSDYATEAPLPTPGGTPYRTPDSLSRRPSRNPSPAPSVIPPSDHHRGRRVSHSSHRISMSHQDHLDDPGNAFDPRRFTPTLHANLVAEILSLRRELESKSGFIDQLESELATARKEHENAADSAAAALKEARDVRRQLARAESDDAVIAVMQEKDDAIEALEELKKQFDRLSKARRIADDDLQRIKEIQERDAQRFEDAKRGLERRAHVAEGRLKAVLDELAAREAMCMSPTAMHYGTEIEDTDGTESEAFSPQSLKRSSTAMSFRGRPQSLFMGDNDAYRLGLSLHAERSPGGLSLAEELEGEESDEEMEEEEAALAERNQTREAENIPEEPEPSESTEEPEEIEAQQQTDAEPDDASTPEEMVTDDESMPEEELPEVDYSEVAVQVVPEVDESERLEELQALLDEKTGELERTYAALDEKTAELDTVYTELDKANAKAAALEEKVESLDKAYARTAELEAKIGALDQAHARVAELEAKVVALDQAHAKAAELEAKVAALDQAHAKAAELEAKVEALDQAHAKAAELEAKVESLGATASEKERLISERDAMHAQNLKIFEARTREVEERWMSLDQKDSELTVKGDKLDEHSKMLDEREKELDERKKGLDDREATLAVALESRPSISLPEEKEKSGVDADGRVEYEANARRKRAAGICSPPARPVTPSTPNYVSVEAQTFTALSPPHTPIPPPEPKLEMTTSSTQTDPVKPLPPRIINVPSIMVSAPPPTPPLPRPVKPSAKNAAVQTNTVSQRTTSMQTEGVNVEERLRRIAPHLLPSAIIQRTNASELDRSPPSPPVTVKHVRRTSKRSNAPISAPRSPPRSVPGPAKASAGMYTSPKPGDEADGERTRLKSSLRRAQLFDQSPAHSSGDEDFRDDISVSGSEFKTALSPPNLKPKKSRTSPAHKLDTPSAAMSDTLVPGPRKKAADMRKSAMVSSGVNAHARTPSVTSSNQTNDSGLKGPPIPVPPRRSSKTPGYTSDRAESPGSSYSGGYAVIRRPSVRRVKSAAVLQSTRDPTNRSQTPNSLSPTSVAPDSPEDFPPPIPKDQVLSPGFNRSRYGQSRHRRKNASINTETTGDASIESSSQPQQTSVVDAISQTMIGEWMWKYVRRRRSFGAAVSPGGIEDTSSGERHRRWVWLAPYERAVMWSSRQPTSGPALLGKTGRKRKPSILHPFGGFAGPDFLDSVLTKKVLIQSVLDVKDDTPPPKGASPSQPIFNRSILILTPARALKFTAPNQERHYVWLTALSFLSHSPPGSEGTLVLPSPMPFEYEQIERQVPALPPPPVPTTKGGFSRTRDSVRVAKGRSRPSPMKDSSSYNSSMRAESIREIENEQDLSTAEPPSVPRFGGSGHSRKRSQTTIGSKPSRGYERSLNGLGGNGSATGDQFLDSRGFTSRTSSLSRNGGGLPGWESNAVGTVRMEAFVSPGPKHAFDEHDEYESRPSSYRLRRDHSISREERYWTGDGEFYGGSAPPPTQDPDDDFWRANDPFKGF